VNDGLMTAEKANYLFIYLFIYLLPAKADILHSLIRRHGVVFKEYKNT
jgi:hypothetical protein